MKRIAVFLLILVVIVGVAFAQGGKEKPKAEGYKFGLLLYSEIDEATISIRTGVEKACKDNNIELETYIIDMDYSKVPGYLQMLIDHGCQAIIDATWSAEVGLVTEMTCKNAGIPLATCDVEYGDYAHLIGASNYGSGQINGEYVADWVTKNWNGKIDHVLGMYYMQGGEGVKSRLDGCFDTLEEKNLITANQILWLDGAQTDVCYGYVMNWLQANPKAKNVYIINNNDTGALGSYNAVVAMGREADCMITSYNCDSFALEHFATTADSPWKASCNFNLGGYGDIAVPALLDILQSGKDTQPHELNTKTFMVDRQNVAEYYK